MTLSQKQRLFFKLITELKTWALTQGYEFTTGEAFRPPETAAIYAIEGRGVANSLHGQKLAEDLNLFVGGVYQPTTEAHRPIGMKWKTLHPACRWGGEFKRADGNHYELNPEHQLLTRERA